MGRGNRAASRLGVGVLLLSGTVATFAGEPVGKRHLIYLHGRIVQVEQSRRPVHPRFGPYELDRILETLSGRGFEVHADVRPESATVSDSADRVVEQVRGLLASGVPPGSITVVGASMGASIALRVAARLEEPEVRFVLVGACLAAGMSEKETEEGHRPQGRILSIREASDDLDGGCPEWSGSEGREIVVHTGLEHGFLYRPLPEWVDPVVDWASAGADSATDGAFLAIVAVVSGLVAWALIRVAPPDHGRRAWIGRRLLATALVWLAIPAILARSGVLDAVPPAALLLLASITVATLTVAFTDVGARVASRIPLVALVGYQAFRVPVEWWLHRMSRAGVVPVQMTWSGRNLDVVSGAGAILIAALLIAGRAPRALVLAWNWVAAGLLVNIVVVAVLSAPTPLRAFPDGPPNLLPSTFPYVWLPSFLVQAALFGHVAVARALSKRP